MCSAEVTKRQHLTGVGDPTLIPPEAYALDQLFLDRPRAGKTYMRSHGCLSSQQNRI